MEDPYRADLAGIDVPVGAIVQVEEDLGDKVKITIETV